MNQKIIVVDNFYDIAHMYHKSFSEHVKEINPQEEELILMINNEKYNIKLGK